MKLDTFFQKFDLFADAPDAVAKMRDLVLELAVTGKLVDQSDAAEAASALLKGMNTQRAKLEAAKTIKVRPLSPVAASDTLFELPSGWVWARLSDVGHELGQKVPNKRFTYVDVGAIDANKGRISDRVEQLEPGDAPSRARKLVTQGTVIYSTVRPYLRNIAIVDREFGAEPIASTAFGILHPFDGMDRRYLFHWLRSAAFTSYVQAAMKGMAYPAINDEKFYGGLIPLPPLAEQKRIVAKVDELMALCDRLETEQQERETRHQALARAALARFAKAPTPANLKFLFHKSYTISPADLRKSILILAVQGKLVPQDPNDEPAADLIARIESELSMADKSCRASELPRVDPCASPYESPAGWAWARFRDVAIIASNLVKPSSYPNLPHLAPDNVEKGSGTLLPCQTVREDNVISSNHHFYTGQIVYAKIRPNLAKVVIVKFEGLCSADMYPIDVLIETRYLHLYMLTEVFLTQAVKSDTRVAMPKINQAKLNSIAVPVPPLAEQRRIVAKVDKLMALVDKLEAQQNAARDTATKLLKAAVAELTQERKSVAVANN